MIFSPDLCEMILTGKKTVTRRPVKLEDGGWGGAIYKPCRYKVGKIYAVQPGRGKKGIGRIRVIDVHREALNWASWEPDREGFRTTQEFEDRWRSLYGSVDSGQPVWRIAFELVQP